MYRGSTVPLRFASANDDSELQERQIDSLASRKPAAVRLLLWIIFVFEKVQIIE